MHDFFFAKNIISLRRVAMTSVLTGFLEMRENDVGVTDSAAGQLSGSLGKS